MPLLSTADKVGIGVGIDLGTTFSACAIMRDGLPHIVEVDGRRTMPSVVTFDDEGRTFVGVEAVAREVESGAYRNVKRVIGTGGKLTKDVIGVVPHLKPNPDGKTYKKNSLLNQLADAESFPTMLQSLDGKDTIRPEEISSKVIAKLKTTVEQTTGSTVTRAAIGVPAYFNDAQRDATKRAAELAGISKVKLLREPEAAALAYGIGKEQLGDDEDELVLVFDLGGGTYDVSMLLVGGGLTEIISTSGNAQLGGSDFDRRVADHFDKLLRSHGYRKSADDSTAANAVLRAAEYVRIRLSNQRSIDLALPLALETWNCMSEPSAIVLTDIGDDLTEAGSSNSTHVLCRLTRVTLERLCRDELQALLRPIREIAIMSSALLPGDASPSLVADMLELEAEAQASAGLAFDDFYNEEEESDGSNQEEESRLLLEVQEIDLRSAKKAQQRGRQKARSVAKKERQFRAEKRKLEQQTDQEVKVRDGISGRPISRVVLVGGATRMPAIGRLLAALTGVVPQKTINPDEAVALGCAVQVGILDGQEGMGTVLTPMQAAIVRAMAEQQGLLDQFDDDDGNFDDIEYY